MGMPSQDYKKVPRKAKHSLVTISRREYEMLLLAKHACNKMTRDIGKHYAEVSLFAVVKEYFALKYRRK